MKHIFIRYYTRFRSDKASIIGRTGETDYNTILKERNRAITCSIVIKL